MNPFFIWSIVIMPVFDVSMALKASRMCLKSRLTSSVMLLTKNFSVSNCIYFGALKSLSFLTILSLIAIGVPYYWILNHGSSRHYEAVMRETGFLSNIFLIKDLASSLISFQSTGSNFSSWLKTFLKIYLLLSPSKGGYQHRKMYSIIPKLQMSHALV